VSSTAWATWAALSGAPAGDGAGAPDISDLMLVALDEIPNANVTIFDRDQRLLLVRGAALRRAGYDSDQLEGKLLHEACSARHAALFTGFYARALAGERVVGEIASSDGLRTYLLRVSPIPGPSGTVVGGVAVATEVTELAAALEALTESEDRYRLLAENSNDFVMRTTPDGIIEWISASILDVLGWEPEEMVGRRSLDFAHPDFVPGVIAATDRVNVGAIVSGRIQVRCKDGSYRWMARTLRPLYGDDGSVVARVSGWHEVQRETEIQEALEASEELFRLAMDTAAIGIFVCEPDGRFVRVNPAMCRMLGYSQDELHARTFADVTHPDDVATSLERAGEVTGGARDRIAIRKRFLRQGGGVVWADVSIAAVRGADGAVMRTIGQAVDVSAEVANFQALQRAARDFRMLAENASDVVLRLDRAGVIEWVSPSVTAVLGWDPLALVGTSALSIIDADDHDEVLRSGDVVFRDGTNEHLLVRYRAAWGGVREMSGTARAITAEDGSVIAAVIGLRDVTEEQRIRRELAYRASHDSLTGVANREDVLSRLRMRLDIPPGTPVTIGVLYCDVDNLKTVNDDLGHPAGDAVLTAVAERLVHALRHQDVVARVGGDEFVVMLHEMADVEQLMAIAEKCRRAVGRAIEVDGRRVEVSVSIGGALAGPDEDADDILARADHALLRAKTSGRDRVEIADVAPGGSARRGEYPM
jgi:diguanylate cyclase (GGDEF)-like protein/PAS domain S-box-containing protein